MVAQDSDDDFSSFVRTCSPALFRSAMLLTGGDRAGAEDLVQHAFAESYPRWDSIDPDKRTAYLRRIMVRSATRFWRRRTSGANAFVDSQAKYTVGNHDEGVAAAVDVWAALRELTPRQRAVIVLRYYEDMTEAQIADALGCSKGAVKSHASRALRALSQRLSVAGYLNVGTDGGSDDATGN